MRTFTKIAGLIVAGSVLAACGGQGASIPTQSTPQSVVQPNAPSSIVDQSAQVQTPADANHWTPIFTTMPATDADTAAIDSGASATIPMFSSTVMSPLTKKTYAYKIVGTNPHTTKTTTNVSYVPITLVIKFPGGITLDPTKPGCSDTVPVATRFYNGPNFNAVPVTSNGVAVGPAQLGDALQRAEFWTVVKGSGYHTVLVGAKAPKVITVTAPSGSSTIAYTCNGHKEHQGLIEISKYDSLIHSIANANATTTQVPVVLSYDVVEYITTTSNCCVIGYHGAYARTGGEQIYAVGAYTDAGFFNSPNILDIYAWTHEIGELFNDPLGNNPTPAWGHIGQVGGCQNNLEVGDPLTGTNPVKVSLGGFTYHAQELAFFDWFYRTAAEGTGGEYSFSGTFETPQAKVCV